MRPTCPARFASRFEAFSAIGSTGDGGVNRVEGTEANGAARRQLVAWLEEDGFTVRIDRVGNIFGLLDFADPDAPWIMAGSHIDSQPCGGRFDGAYGVIAAVEVAAALRKEFARTASAPNPQPRGGRLGRRGRGALQDPARVARFHRRDADRDDPRRPDAQGVSLREALASIGFLGADPARRSRSPTWSSTSNAVPNSKPKAVVSACSNAGGASTSSTSLSSASRRTRARRRWKRKDALYAAAQVIAGVRHLADAASSGDLYTSVGKLVVAPNSPNVVPSAATASFDCARPSSKSLTPPNSA